MLKSMTGFGRFEAGDEFRRITVEMKAVNHRYCEITLKMPKKLNIFEAAVRTKRKQFINRGKVDIFVTYTDSSEGQISLTYNKELAAEYLRRFSQISEEFGIENDVKTSTVARMPDVLVPEEADTDDGKLEEILLTAIEGAAKQLVETRTAEGERLKSDILAKLDGMLVYVDEIEKRMPEVVKEYRERIIEKVKELLGDTKLDESALATEIVLYSDRICVDEEMVRLRAHIAHMRDCMEEENCGRKLDFIAQEMNREANTTLSKCGDLKAADCAINLKTEIEKIREQIQNIE
ncbi:MAG: YicC family protein [Lachnospiraceae bacterium]|nr:YicC family protein [Lachnospiraceae bacterium]